MITTTTMPHRKSPRTKQERAQRDARRLELIMRLHDLGDTDARIAFLVGLTPRRIGQMIAAYEQVAGLAPAALLTPEQKRDLTREHATDPVALEWLARQRTDRRHNRCSMDSGLTYKEDFDSIDAAL